MKLYIVVIRKGEYEDAERLILGVYDTEEKAVQVNDYYVSQMQELKSKYSYKDINRLDDLRRNVKEENWTNEIIQFNHWNNKLKIPEFSHNAHIEEIELNKEVDINQIITMAMQKQMI